jgi:hypothetical protein
VNFRRFFVGGVPGETYAEGVRRRIRTAGFIWAQALVSLALTYGVFSLSDSRWATVGAATLCGIISSKAVFRLEPIRGEAPRQTDKVLWMVLFAPALILLGAAAVYTAQHAEDGFNMFKAGLAAWGFGCVVGSTAFFLFGADSRARA